MQAILGNLQHEEFWIKNESGAALMLTLAERFFKKTKECVFFNILIIINILSPIFFVNR